MAPNLRGIDDRAFGYDQANILHRMAAAFTNHENVLKQKQAKPVAEVQAPIAPIRMPTNRTRKGRKARAVLLRQAKERLLQRDREQLADKRKLKRAKHNGLAPRKHQRIRPIKPDFTETTFSGHT